MTISDVPRELALAGLERVENRGLNQSIEVRGEVYMPKHSFIRLNEDVTLPVNSLLPIKKCSCWIFASEGSKDYCPSRP